MKKKDYLKPEIMVMAMTEETSILAGSNPNPTVNINDDDDDKDQITTGNIIYAPKRQDLWDDEDE